MNIFFGRQKRSSLPRILETYMHSGLFKGIEMISIFSIISNSNVLF